MRVRALSPTGDMTFGQGQSNFLINSPAAVAQNIRTRLGLWVGQWFLDQTTGMPWLQYVLGAHTVPFYDAAIRDNILGAPGVIGFQSYSSTLGTATRALTLDNPVVNSQYGTVTLNSLYVAPPV